MSTEIANQDDHIVMPDITGDDIVANLDFLWAAGLLPGVLLPPEEPPAIKEDSIASAMLGLISCKGPHPRCLGENEPVW